MMASGPAMKCGIFFLILNLILFLGFEKKRKSASNLLQVNLDLIRIERNNQIDNGANILVAILNTRQNCQAFSKVNRIYIECIYKHSKKDYL